MYRIHNQQTNPIALPIIDTEEVMVKDFEPDDEGRHHMVYRKEESIKAHTLFIKGTHGKRVVTDPEFEDVSNETYDAIAKAPMFDRLIKEGKLRVTKFTKDDPGFEPREEG